MTFSILFRLKFVILETCKVKNKLTVLNYSLQIVYSSNNKSLLFKPHIIVHCYVLS